MHNKPNILISTQPEWCEKIASGEKTIEVRKTKPKIDTPFKCYIYETKNTRGVNGFTVLGRYRIGKVIGEFVCRGIMRPYSDLTLMAKYSCLTIEELNKYANGKELYGWRIDDLKIYDKPQGISNFFVKGECDGKGCAWCSNFYRGTYYLDGSGFDEDDCIRRDIKPLTRPPQSWCYVEEIEVMREILFRGKRVDDGEWVEGYYHTEIKLKEINNERI